MQKIFERLPSKKEGYWMVKVPKAYPTGKPYDSEHRAIWWWHTGELPPPGYCIHHINADKTDNRIENLEVVSHAEHVKKEGHLADLEPAPEEELACFHCKKLFIKTKYTLTYRRNLGQTDFFCTKSCQVTYQNQFRKGKKNNYPKNRDTKPGATIILNCHACNKEFSIPERVHRARLKAGAKKFSCSRACINRKSII
jgi:hypothetical protein